MRERPVRPLTPASAKTVGRATRARAPTAAKRVEREVVRAKGEEDRAAAREGARARAEQRARMAPPARTPPEPAVTRAGPRELQRPAHPTRDAAAGLHRRCVRAWPRRR